MRVVKKKKVNKYKYSQGQVRLPSLSVNHKGNYYSQLKNKKFDVLLRQCLLEFGNKDTNI